MMSWKDLNQFFSLECSSEDNKVAFKTRDDPLAKKCLTSLVESISEQIDTEAEKLLQSFPQPDAPLSAWNIKSENELFPADTMENCRVLDELQVPPRVKDRPYSDYNRRETWEYLATRQSRNAAIIVLHALNAPSPFQHLHTLVYLAQRARVTFHVLLKIPTRFQHVSTGNEVLPVTSYVLQMPYGSPLMQYIFLTIAQYMFINTLEALNDGPTCLANGSARQMAAFPSGNDVCWIATGFDGQSKYNDIDPKYHNSPANDWFLARRDSVHGDFWYASTDGERKERDPNAREEYKARCLSVIVAWYAIMKAMSDRNRAVGFRRVLFDKSDLERLITDVFLLTWPSFTVPSPLSNPMREVVQRISSLVDTQVETREYHLTDASILRPTQPLSSFYNLPSEIHLHILSLLSTQQLLCLSQVSVFMHLLSLPSLYMDPLQYIISSSSMWPEEEGTSDEKTLQRIVQLQTLLLSRADLRRCVCSFLSRAGPPRNGGYTRSEFYAIPILCPLANGLTNLRHLTLTLDFPTSTAFLPHSFLALRIALRQYNQLVTLHILILPSLSSLTPIFPGPPSVDISKSSRWPLRNLTISTYDRADDYGSVDGGFPVTDLLQFFGADALTSLTLRYQNDVGPFQSFPIFPTVRRLNISSAEDTTPTNLQSVLHRSFPSLENLSMEFPPRHGGPRFTVNLASSSPLLQSVTFASNYRVVELPPTTRKVAMDWADLQDILDIDKTVSLISDEVLAFKVSLSKIWQKPRLELEVVRAMPVMRLVPVMYPRIHSLEIYDSGPNSLESQDEVAEHKLLLAALSNVFPRLEVLITSLCDFNNRPRRVDFPLDDGIDEIEHGYALDVFKQFPCLKMASFTGLSTPEDRDLPNVSRRVWARSGESGVDARVVREIDLPDYVFL